MEVLGEGHVSRSGFLVFKFEVTRTRKGGRREGRGRGFWEQGGRLSGELRGVGAVEFVVKVFQG